MSGLGGDGFSHFTDASGRGHVYNGCGSRARRSATAERFASGIEVYRAAQRVGCRGCLAGIGALHAAHGSLPWAQLVAPAIRLARDGLRGDAQLSCCSPTSQQKQLEVDPNSRPQSILGKHLADLVVQPELARTLEEIAADGAEGFYRGRLAARLAQGNGRGRHA